VIVLHIFYGLFQNTVKLGGTWGFIANLSSSSRKLKHGSLVYGNEELEMERDPFRKKDK
jgi:hypothetical protein